MRNQCRIKNCNNDRSKGFHLFRFPLRRKDHLKRWLEAIGEVNFQPTKSDVICSAHFTTNDYYMIRPFAHDVRLKRLAVPSVFQDSLETTPMIANIINSNASASEMIMSLPTLVIHSQTKKSENSEEAETYCFQLLEKIANTSTVDNTIKITLINKQKMNKFKYYFKNQKMNLKKKQMQTFITTLKQDLIKNKKTVQLQQDLLTGIV